MWAIAALVGGLLAVPCLAAAQDLPANDGAVQAAPAPRGLGIRVFGAVDITRMTAARTFDAVLGSPTVRGFGGGVDVLRLWRGAFARVAMSRTTKDGARVVVVDDEVTPVGVSTSVRMMPLEIGGGWRLAPNGRMVPYAGGGLYRLSFEETTDFDERSDDTSATFMGSVFFGGLDVRLSRLLSVGAELQHRRLANAIGQAGASAAFNEHDLGGLTVRIWVGFGR